ncbi:MAG: hypothetical protein R2774_05405 [Saprospiraceae bacterium]
MSDYIINISEDFSRNPGARYISDGKYSGEAFLNDILEPTFLKAKSENVKLRILLDNVIGYPASFVSGSFGVLSLKYGSEIVLNHIVLESELNPARVEKIIYEIQNPTSK